MKTGLSVVVLTKNGERKLKDCLGSVSFADELIVVDNNSTDKTIRIAKKLKAKVIKTNEKYFNALREEGRKQVTKGWVLYLDQDELISEKLKKEILIRVRTEEEQKDSSYKIYRKNIMLGKWLKNGGWWPDPMHRLFKTRALKGWEGKVHERPIVTGEIGIIEEPIIHNTKDSVEQMIANSKKFGEIEAELMIDNGHPPVTLKHYIAGCFRVLWERGIKQAGWRDGAVGVILIFYQVIHQWMVYSFLWEKQMKEKANG